MAALRVRGAQSELAQIERALADLDAAELTSPSIAPGRFDHLRELVTSPAVRSEASDVV